MSGGHFDYKQYAIGDIADQIDYAISEQGYTPQTIAEFCKAVRALRVACVYAQRVDWLLSGDDGEDTFATQLAEDLQKVELMCNVQGLHATGCTP